MVPIVKVIVLNLLTCKIGRDVDLLPGKPILAIMQISTLKFAKIRKATLGHGIPLQNLQIRRKISSLKKLVKLSREEIFSLVFSLLQKQIAEKVV